MSLPLVTGLLCGSQNAIVPDVFRSLKGSATLLAVALEGVSQSIATNRALNNDKTRRTSNPFSLVTVGQGSFHQPAQELRLTRRNA